MKYLSILDYSTGNSLIVEDEDSLLNDLQNEDIENLLESIGFHSSEINWMVTDEDPRGQRVSLRDLTEENYDRIESVCLKRMKGAES